MFSVFIALKTWRSFRYAFGRFCFPALRSLNKVSEQAYTKRTLLKSEAMNYRQPAWYVKLVASAFQKILRGTKLTWYMTSQSAFNLRFNFLDSPACKSKTVLERTVK